MAEEKAEAAMVTAGSTGGRLPGVIAPGLAGIQEGEAEDAGDS